MSVEIQGVQVDGYFDDRFAATIEQFASNFANGDDTGASFAMSKDGEMLIDVWAGHLDEEKSVRWEAESLVNVFSSTKTVSFLCALVLADRGLLDFDAPVSRYWPEFAQNGKADVLVWHFMNHAAGLPGIDEPIGTEAFYDWNKMTGLLAAQAPWWEPGTATGYHAFTQGFLIGELVRRITGKTLGEFTRDELASPLDADFYIGVPDAVFPRIGNLLIPEGQNEMTGSSDPTSIPNRAFSNPPPDASSSWTDEWRRAEIPAANGHGNARSLVRLQTPLACGGTAFGVELMSAATARSVMIPRIEGTDLVLEAPLTFGLGFGLNRGPIPLSPNENTCFWGGWGGSSVQVDQDARVAMSYVMNRMFPGTLGDTRSFNLRGQVYKDLG